MKRAVLLLAIAMCGAHANSSVLTPEAALNRAQATTSARHIQGINATRAELLTTYTANNQPAVYLFGRGDNGYLVVSADDMTDAILGYCDEGTIDVNNMPPAMTYMLESYADQIAFVRANAVSTTMAAHQSPERAAIHPMCSTIWSQNSPYNNLCPNQYATGCTATALAQVLKYFGNIQGSGTASYTWNSQTLSYDFDANKLDWENMLDSYGNDATDTQKSAVANLMYACGVTLQMNYKSGGSAAYAINAVKYSADYFNLDKGIGYYSRDYFGYDEWNNLIYDALKNCGPVMLGGSIVNTSYTYAHEFVCDGYASDDLFHINWGWGGEYDGYFRLGALDPYSHGIVPTKSAYNYYQDAVCYIQPAKEGSTPFTQLCCSDFNIRNSTAKLGYTISLNSTITNYSSRTISGTLGVKISDINGKFLQYLEARTSFTDIAIGGSIGSTSARLPSEFADGTYTLTPVYKETDGDWVDLQCKPGAVSSYTMNVASGKATFTADASGAVQMSDFKLDTPFYASTSNQKMPFRFSAKASAEKEYYGKIALAFFDDDNTLTTTYSYVPLAVPADETIDVEIYENSTEITAGKTYRLALIDGAGNVLTDYIEATVETGSPGSWEATMTDMTIANADAVDMHDLDMTFKISCTDGFLYEGIWLCAYNSSDRAAESWEVYPVALVAGETKDYHYHADFHKATPGETYTLYPISLNSQKWLSREGWKFTIAADCDAVSNITANTAEVVSTEYYNLQGVRLGAKVSAPGLYIKVEKLTDGTRRATRTVIR